MIEGIDISHWNWSKLIKERFTFNTFAISNFIIMKATQGLRYKDDKMIRFMQEIYTPVTRNYDKHIGFYHFADAKTADSWKAEANNFISSIQSYIGYYPVLALDVEADALNKKYIDEWSAAFISYVEEKTGIKPMLYCSQSACKKFKKTCETGAGLWVAKYGKEPTKAQIKPWTFYAIWQYTSKPYDLDKFNSKSLDAWYKYGGHK